MVRALVALVGLLLAAVPGRVVDWYDRVALEDPTRARRSPTYLLGARVEGVVLLGLAMRGGEGYRWLMNVLGIGGVIAFLAPRRALAFSSRVAYENPDDLEWTDRLPAIVRVLGLLYVLMGIREGTLGRGP